MKIKYSIDDTVTPEEVFAIGQSNDMDNFQTIKRNKKAIKSSSFIATARFKEKLIGILRLISDGAYIIHVAELSVHKEFQRKGIGTKLIGLGKAWAKKIQTGTGKHHGEFTVFANIDAYEFYQNSQFIRCKNGMFLADCPERRFFEHNFQENWEKRHLKPNQHLAKD